VAKNFGETKNELDLGKMGSKSEQGPGNPYDLSERIIRASDKYGY